MNELGSTRGRLPRVGNLAWQAFGAAGVTYMGRRDGFGMGAVVAGTIRLARTPCSRVCSRGWMKAISSFNSQLDLARSPLNFLAGAMVVSRLSQVVLSATQPDCKSTDFSFTGPFRTSPSAG